MFTQRIVAHPFMRLVLLFTLIVSSSVVVRAQQSEADNIRQALINAVTALKGAPPQYGTFIDIKAIDRQNKWAFGTIVLLTPTNQNTQDAFEQLPEGFIWLAQKMGVSWGIAFEYTPTFLDWVPNVPPEVLDPELKRLFLSAKGSKSVAPSGNMKTLAAGDPSGDLALPWWPGQAWNLRGGPHPWGGCSNNGCPRPWSSIDLNGGDGKVLAARRGTALRMCGTSTWIRVVHEGGWATDYYHIINLAVADNTSVEYLRYLGDIGTATACGGSASGPHVHFAIRLNGNYIDWNGREVGGWTVYEGGTGYQGRMERAYAGGNTVVNVGSSAYNIGVQYQAHVQNIGWQSPQANGGTAGTVGQNLRMEAINISLIKPTGTPGNVSICYEAHVQNIGWQGERCDGQTAGTIGQSLRIEAIKMRLVNPPNRAGVCYRANVEGIGWQGWVCNNAIAGTTGQARRLEALQILITPGSLFP